MRNPRLTDAFDLPYAQEHLPFLIPHLREDLPACIDPFLLWNSSDDEWRFFHGWLIDFFDEVRRTALSGDILGAMNLLLRCEEQPALGLGYAEGTKAGSSIGPHLARAIVEVLLTVSDLRDRTPNHIEELQLLVPRLKEDRISDIAAAVLKGPLVDYTERTAAEFEIPTRRVMVPYIWEPRSLRWGAGRAAALPFNPQNQEPILLVPLAWLRTLPWINYGDYYQSHFSQYIFPGDRRRRKVPKSEVLAYNRANYIQVERYVRKKEESAALAFPEYYFTPLNESRLRRRRERIASIQPGNLGGADKAYEESCFEFLQSAFYPELDYAESQVRTEGGTHIRDVIFYNDGKTDFLRELRNEYGSRQLVFELKNVKGLEGKHVDQLYRYLGNEFGRIGVLVARTPPGTAVRKNITDLYASKKVVILAMDDADLQLVLTLRTQGRSPATSILKKKLIDFQRRVPV